MRSDIEMMEALAAEYVTEMYTMQPDGSIGRLNGVGVLDECGEHLVTFTNPLLAIKVAARILEIAGRVTETQIATYDEVMMLNALLHGDEMPEPLMNLVDRLRDGDDRE